MGKLILVGAMLLGFHGHASQQRQYWWPAQDVCTITSGTDRHGVWHAHPFIQCTAIPAHYSTTPPPAEQGIPADSPAAQAFNQNYCPSKPGGWCTPPADPVNITPTYNGD